jgi:hypothetical protein
VWFWGVGSHCSSVTSCCITSIKLDCNCPRLGICSSDSKFDAFVAGVDRGYQLKMVLFGRSNSSIECKAELVAKGQALSTIAPHRNRNIQLAIVEVNLRCIWLVGAFEIDIGVGILSTVIILGL